MNNSNASNGLTKVVDVELSNFEYIPSHMDEIVFFQQNSRRILFGKLPTRSQKSNTKTNFNKVFCIGTHLSKIVCISVRANGHMMLFATFDGSICCWRLSDGFMLFETNVPIAQPKDYYFNPSSKEKCSMCSEPLEINCAYLPILLFINMSPIFAMGCLDGLIRLRKITCGNLQSNDESMNLELIFEETLLPSILRHLLSIL